LALRLIEWDGLPYTIQYHPPLLTPSIPSPN
jgi:hypothetical protein